MEPKYWNLAVSVLSIKMESEPYNDTIGFKIMLSARKRGFSSLFMTKCISVKNIAFETILCVNTA